MPAHAATNPKGSRCGLCSAWASGNARDVEVRSLRVRTQLLVRTHKSLISSGTETSILSGHSDANSHWHKAMVYPCHPGYSMVGTVEEVGSAVSHIRVGDRVTALREHRSYVVAEASRSVVVPDTISDEGHLHQPVNHRPAVGSARSTPTCGDRGLSLLGWEFSVSCSCSMRDCPVVVRFSQ